MSTINNARTLYRQLLRELPPLNTKRTTLHLHLRNTFAGAGAPMPVEHAHQLIKYLQSQRMYVTLLERYNPGLVGDHDVQEHTRLTGRRVGLNMPKSYEVGQEGEAAKANEAGKE